MKRSLKYFVIFSLLVSTCKKDEDIGSRTIDLGEFKHIELEDVFIVHLTEDTIFSMEIVADNSFLDNIKYSLESEKLTVWNETGLDWVSPRSNKIELHIHSHPLELLVANETCDIKTTNPITSDEFGIVLKNKANEASLGLDCNTFFYWNEFPCGGRLTLSGNAQEIKIWNHALLTVDATELDAQHALVENSSKGNCMVNVSQSLTYSIFGVGDIHLYGSPGEIIENEVTSTGELILF